MEITQANKVLNPFPVMNPDNGDAPLQFVEPPYQPPSKARLYAKMAMVMANLKAIPKRGKNKDQGYDYVTDGDLYDAVRTEMAKVNLALLVRMKDIRKEVETKTYKDGGTKDTTTTLVDLDFTLCCGDTGATETIRWTGSTNNPGDKAISAAVTIAEKYFLKATFIISTGDLADDPDSGVSRRPARKPEGEAAAPSMVEPDPMNYIRLGIRTGIGDDTITDSVMCRLLGIEALTKEAIKAKYEGKSAKAVVQIALDAFEAELRNAAPEATPEAAKSEQSVQDNAGSANVDQQSDGASAAKRKNKTSDLNRLPDGD